MVEERKLLILYGSQTGTAQEVGRISVLEDGTGESHISYRTPLMLKFEKILKI
jgi:hypothetical protein